ncbi:MAG: alpha/beta hydrolase [Chloroflexota bacterium]|nr:MAG: phospholipase [Chloroflexota bacterium]
MLRLAHARQSRRRTIIETVHQSQPVLSAGMAIEEATAALVMLHGRGASAQDILTLARELNLDGFACLAPQAAGNTWYPYPFMQPVARNEPYLSSALQAVAAVFKRLSDGGIAPDRVIVLGFSQGACLALEYAARHPRRYGGVVGFSGGLIGEGDRLRDYDGSLEGTPVFLGCSDVDPYIPLERVRQTAVVLRRLNAEVEERIYPGMGHMINQDEVSYLQSLMDGLRQPHR